MKQDDEKEAGSVKLRTDLDQKKENRQVELSPEALEKRQQIEAFLVQGPEERVKKAKELEEARKKEVVTLKDGKVKTLGSYLAESIQEYFPMFPNDNPFFAEMFRLAGWHHLDSNEYVKPLIARQWLVETIYYRFHKEAVPMLRAKIKYRGKHKLFQLLNEEGQALLIQFRDEAVDMMRTFQDGQIHEFRMAYAKKYGTAVQLELIH